MEARDVEALALEIRRQSGVGDDVVVALTKVIEHHMGPDRIEFVDRMIGYGALVKVHGEYRIVLRRSYGDLRFVAAHEFGHWVFAKLGLELGVEEERAANTFAAALLAPATLVERAYAFFGERTSVIAAKLLMSQTSAILRLGEVRGDVRAVVTRNGNVMVRNESADLTRERAASVARSRSPKGIAKSRLRGGIDEGRVSLRVA